MCVLGGRDYLKSPSGLGISEARALIKDAKLLTSGHLPTCPNAHTTRLRLPNTKTIRIPRGDGDLGTPLIAARLLQAVRIRNICLVFLVYK
ncbi:hypothetical protein CCACVL1_28031 [Corchorus capsularis]|uniref:Uncharacterized protein n=1 Tax=Corchorus capsularis TaxID=210143 RepID=A0A1R3G7W4_COCAP|nr:hypothetical protein CCACVL1_28031 [Corchorus capsularis]